MPNEGEQNLEIVKAIEREISELKERIVSREKEARVRVELLEEIAPDLAKQAPSRFRKVEPPAERPEKAGSTERVKHEDMVDWCRQILLEAGRELKLSDIHARLEENPDWRVPGAGKPQNVYVHLMKANKVFTRNPDDRGMWGLAEWSPQSRGESG